MADATSIICPGQQAMFGQSSDPHYLMVSFFVTYEGQCPNIEKLYLHNYPLVPWGLSVERTLEADVLARIKSHPDHAHAIAARYICYQGQPMSDAEVTEAGWRFIEGNMLRAERP